MVKFFDISGNSIEYIPLKIILVEKIHEYPRLFCAVEKDFMAHKCEMEGVFRGTFLEEIQKNNFKYIVFAPEKIDVKENDSLIFYDSWLEKFINIDIFENNFMKIQKEDILEKTHKESSSVPKKIHFIQEEKIKNQLLKLYFKENMAKTILAFMFLANKKVKHIEVKQKEEYYKLEIQIEESGFSSAIVENKNPKARGEKIYKQKTNEDFIKKKMAFLNLSEHYEIKIKLNLSIKINEKISIESEDFFINQITHHIDFLFSFTSIYLSKIFKDFLKKIDETFFQNNLEITENDITLEINNIIKEEKFIY